VDVKAMDVYYSFTYASTKLVDRKVPWRVGREKHFVLIQIVIGTLTTPRSVVRDT
jgi:hypothetical protein